MSRSDVTWNPSVCSAVKDSLICATTEEYMLPVIHGNDRVEWFVQLTDEIQWDVSDRDTGEPRARVVMKAGDVSAMPADIRHQGYSPKRSILLVWENNDAQLPELVCEEAPEIEPGGFLVAENPPRAAGGARLRVNLSQGFIGIGSKEYAVAEQAIHRG